MSLQLPDIAQCADEPIRVPGAIQPHGWVIILSAADGHLVAHSQNCPDLNALEGALAPLREGIADLMQGDSPAALGIVEVASEAYGALAHRRDDIVVIEFELRLSNSGLQAPMYSLARNFLPELQKAESVQKISMLAASELKRLTGFGRCNVYSFDSSGHGQVLAEEKEPGYASFMGHHFPAADIPAQARDLYVLNHFRLIPDARYQPVPLHCVDPAWRPETIDLSLTVLRSVSPVHLEYMRNMGTLASMSVSIVVGGQLWGMISCHDHQPRFLPFQTRVACEHLGRLVSMQIAAKQDNADMAEQLELRKLTHQIVSYLAQSDATLQQLTSEPAVLLRLASASGAAVIHNDDCWTAGATPHHEQIHALARWVIASGERVCYRHRLADEFPPAAAYPELAAGLLAISISKVHRHLILWFRPQIMQTIEWAGDPRKALGSEDGRIHPRLSFATWKEKISGQSMSWSPATVTTAAELRHALIDIVLVRTEEMANVFLQLSRANEKIKSFSHSVSHELRQPLISIGGFSRVSHKRFQAAGDGKGMHYSDRIFKAALQAEAITETLLELAQISGVNLKRDVIDLSEEVAAVMGHLREQEPARQVNVLIEPGMKASGDVKLLQVALAHLIGNAWKFTSTRANGEISIGSGLALNGERMWWIHDNGVGFDMAYSSKLFQPFHRLHDSGAFDGLGVGLAVAHAAITRQGGSIWADALPDGGAKLYFTLGQEINSTTAI